MKVARSASSGYAMYQSMAVARAKRQVVNNRIATMSTVGSVVFSAKATQAQGLNQIAAKQYAARVSSAAQAKLQSLNKIS